MSSLLCAICLDTLQTKIALSATCGHIFCSECATPHFTTRPACPVCRRVQTFNQLIRLFPEYGTVFREASSGATLSPDIGLPQKQNPETLLRIHIDSTGTRFPWTQAGVAPACDLDGSPVFLGLAAFKHGLHPCKIRVEPKGRPVPFVSYDSKEYEHRGTTFLLPFDRPGVPWTAPSGLATRRGRLRAHRRAEALPCSRRRQRGQRSWESRGEWTHGGRVPRVSMDSLRASLGLGFAVRGERAV
ncbi:hypothetical protein V8D89_016130 [Ganoderma adspersum]